MKESKTLALPNDDLAAAQVAARVAGEQAAVTAVAEAETARLARYSPEIHAAAALLGVPVREVASVRRESGDLRIVDADGVEFVFVERDRPDGAGRRGLLRITTVRNSPVPQFTPRPGPIARGRAKRVARKAERAKTVPSAPADAVVVALEADLARAEADVERRPGAGPPAETVAALRAVLRLRRGQVADVAYAAAPPPPTASEVASWRATRGWARDMLNARSDADVAATRSRWASVDPETFSLRPYHARLELDAANQWFSQHDIDAEL